jgi:hypothetical protein
MNEYCDVCECDPCDCYDGCPPGQKPLKKIGYAYVLKDGTYFVPRAPSFCIARERNDKFKSKLNVEPLIVNPREWELLTKNNSVEYFETKDV